MKVRIFHRPGYSDGNAFWYFDEENRDKLYDVVESEDAEKYLVVSDEGGSRYINKIDCKIVNEQINEI